jgi:ring-1,2-phenylacetyl-CoA epoxidase subunit PaaC
VDTSALEEPWRAAVEPILARAGLVIPGVRAMQRGGRAGRHTEHLGHMLAEMQIVARSFPGASW